MPAPARQGGRRLDVACDIGGAFVDLVALAPGVPAIVAKRPRREAGLRAILLDALDAAGIAPAEVGRLRLSTTLATNALLAGEAAPVALVATAGFTDVLELGRQSRHDPDAWPPPPPTPPWLAPEAWRIPLRGRIAADGAEAEPPALADLDALRELPPGTPVALCLLFAHRNPAHELAAAARIAQLRPDLPLSLSHRVDPQPREFERMLATLVDASLKPLAARLLRAEGLPEPWVMRAEGGLAPLSEALARPLGLVGSGPAAGAVAAARAAEGGDAIGLDIGSATTEVSLHRAGQPLAARGVRLGAMWLRGAALDVESLPVGGGTALAWHQGRLRLPGSLAPPGEGPTLADAALVAAGTPLRGLAPALAEDAVDQAVAWIAEGVRRIAFRRNLDPARAKLVVGGGAGPLLSQRLAAAIRPAELVMPAHARLLAATGLAAAPAMLREESPCDLPLTALGALAAAVQRHEASLRARCAAWGAPVALRHALDLAPGPRAEPVLLDWSPREAAGALAARYLAATKAQRGQASPGLPRILALRSIATATLGPP